MEDIDMKILKWAAGFAALLVFPTFAQDNPIEFRLAPAKSLSAARLSMPTCRACTS
jgi:hypothetical protein